MEESTAACESPRMEQVGVGMGGGEEMGQQWQSPEWGEEECFNQRVKDGSWHREVSKQ